MTDETPPTTAEHEQFANELACLRDRIEDLENALEAKDERIDDFESDRDRLEETTERLRDRLEECERKRIVKRRAALYVW